MDYPTTMQPGVLRNLKDLRTLDGLEINNMEQVEELGYLTQLMKLSICVALRSPKTYSFSCASKSNESHLTSLLHTLHDYEKPVEKVNLNIKNPPSLLQSLHFGASIKIPYWLGSLSYLAKLTLAVETMDDLEVIKTLPNLLRLTLYKIFNMPQELSFSTGGFRSLKILKIFKPFRIEFQMDCLPVLQKLVFVDCQELALVIGIALLPCLQEIQLESVPKGIIEVLKLEAEKHKNIPKLMAIDVEDSN